jgi:hypothetical protein
LGHRSFQICSCRNYFQFLKTAAMTSFKGRVGN